MFEFHALPTQPSLLAAPGVPLIHRDLSWLQFNTRVLSEATALKNPVVERMRFLAISASNFDEFFTIRFALMNRKIQALQNQKRLSELRRLLVVRNSLFARARKLQLKQGDALVELSKALASESIRICVPTRMPTDQLELSQRVFNEQVLPYLGAPQPFTPRNLARLENLQSAILFQDGVWIPLSRSLPSAFMMEEGGICHVFFLDHLLHQHAPAAYRKTGHPVIIRLTRDGDFAVDLEEEDSESIPDIVRSGLGTREAGRPVRLQYFGRSGSTLLHKSLSALKLGENHLFQAPRTLGLHGLLAIASQIQTLLPENRDLYFPTFQSTFPPRFQGVPLAQFFDLIRADDAVLHHPYDSFECFVAFIEAACTDSKVTEIALTVYRMDAESPVIEILKSAAGQGKRIRVCIELRARFDERNNLILAENLRSAGVDVTFGFGQLKLHAKIALIKRTEGAESRYYTHLSTGNYNAKTARQYEDLAIFTYDQEIGADAELFFDAIWKQEIPSGFRKLVLAPTRLHRLLAQHIDAETRLAKQGKIARIVAKVNSLVDEAIIQKLYDASSAGVKVDLIVRGACSLIPGVKGLSENIRVISVIDRFLEHSRIYFFEGSGHMYLSSADWMPRNFFSRLEIAFPVTHPRIHEFIRDTVLPAYWDDTDASSELTSRGNWRKRSVPAQDRTQARCRAQFLFIDMALNGYEGTPLQHPNSISRIPPSPGD